MANTTVSYAQAAKRVNSTPSQPTAQPAASPALSSQTKDDGVTVNSTSTAPSSVSTNDVETHESSSMSQNETESSTAKQDDTEVASVADTNSSAVSVSDKNEKPIAEAESNSTELPSGEDNVRSSSRTSRSPESVDGKKNRKGKKVRASDKDAETEKSQEAEKEIPKPVLTESKPPSVNPWTQRAEAQQAKAKVAASSAVNTTNGAASGAAFSEPKKRNGEEHDSTWNQLNGANAEKAQRKPTDASKSVEHANRRTGPRGSRADREDKANGVVPPVADASLWPDPKSADALEEEKRKTQEKNERSDAMAQTENESGKNPKQKWEKVDFVPTVAFATPLPPRNGKPRGATRGGRETGTGRGGSTTGSAGAANSSPNPSADKTAALNGSTTVKSNDAHQRDGSVSVKGASTATNASKRASVDVSGTRDQRKMSTVTGESSADAQACNDNKGEGSRTARGEAGQINAEAPSFSSRNDRRNDSAKDAHQGANHQSFGREGRNDRGRGGYRRGGHGGSSGSHAPQAGFPPQNGGQYPAAHGAFPPRQNGPYSPPTFQTTFPNSYGANSGRGGRGNNSRSHSGSVAGRGSSNNHGYPPKMAQFAPGNHYDYNMQQYPAPYTYPIPAYEPSIIQIAQAQVEYYMSINNLCKDRFLRTRMNSDGWVEINVIAHFKRMVELTKGDKEIVRTACLLSEQVEVVVGDDGVERLRARGHWQSFVLPDEERVPESRGSLAQNLYPVPRHTMPGPYPGHAMPPVFTPTSPTAYANGYSMDEQVYQGYMNGGHFEQGPGGVDVNGHIYQEGTQLSATVPEFSPNSTNHPLTLDGMTSFPDAKVEHLMMVVESSQSNHPTTKGVVVNGTAGSEDVATNGDAASGNSEPYVSFRAKALEERKSAKAGETSWLMRQLYEFWAGFLVGNFNAKMYDEFRSLAIEDANQENPSHVGLKNLLRYYSGLLHGDQPKPWGPDRPVPEIFTLHYQEADGLNQGVNGDARA